MKRCYGGSGRPCSGHAPGGMFAAIVLLLALGFPSLAARADSACAIDPVSGQVTSTGNCYIEPDSYRVFIYEVGFCTEQPVLPTADVAFDAGDTAIKLFESGSEPLLLEVKNGESSLLSSLLVRPPDGTYTHGYVILAPRVEVKAHAKFSRALQTNKSDGTGLKDDIPANTVCYSRAGADVYRYKGDPKQAAQVSTSAGDWGYTTFHFNSLEPNTQSYSSGGSFLVSVDGKIPTSAIAENEIGDVSKMIVLFQLDASVVRATRGLDLSFNVSQGSTIVQTEAGVLTCFNGDPFEVRMQVR